MDIQFPQIPLVTTSAIGMYLNATIFNATSGYRVPHSVISDVKLNFSSKSQMLVDTSSWATDSVLDMVHNSGILKMALD